MVSQPSTVDAFIDAALDAGATALKPAKKSFWGYGGVVQAPDGDDLEGRDVVEEGHRPGRPGRSTSSCCCSVSTDVKATKQFYVEPRLAVGKSFGSKYVEFDTPGSPVKLALYARRAAAKDAGVDPDGTGSHRIVIGSDAEPFTDPDGFVWGTASG